MTRLTMHKPPVIFVDVDDTLGDQHPVTTAAGWSGRARASPRTRER